MKIIHELAIIFAITLCGEMVSSLLPFTIPPAIVALVLLLVLLLARIVKPSQIETTSNWLLSNMSILFIPACVSILEHIELLKSAWWQIIVISIVSFLLTFLAAGYSVIAVQKLMERGKCTKN